MLFFFRVGRLREAEIVRVLEVKMKAVLFDFLNGYLFNLFFRITYLSTLFSHHIIAVLAHFGVVIALSLHMGTSYRATGNWSKVSSLKIIFETLSRSPFC